MNLTCDGIRSCCQAYVPILCSDKGNTEHVMNSLIFLAIGVLISKACVVSHRARMDKFCVSQVKNLPGFTPDLWVNVCGKTINLPYSDATTRFINAHRGEW